MKTIIPVCAATLVAFPLLAMTADELAESSSVSIVLGGSTTAAPSTLRSMLAVTHDDHDHGDEAPSRIAAEELMEAIAALTGEPGEQRMAFDLAEMTEGRVHGQAVIEVDGMDLAGGQLDQLLEALGRRLAVESGDVEIEVDLNLGHHEDDEDDWFDAGPHGPGGVHPGWNAYGPAMPFPGTPYPAMIGQMPRMMMNPAMMVPGDMVFGHAEYDSWHDEHDGWEDDHHPEFEGHHPEDEFRHMEREMHELHRHLEMHHAEMDDREREEIHREIDHLREMMEHHREMMNHHDGDDHGHHEDEYFHLADQFVNKVDMSQRMADALNEREAVAVFAIWMARQQMSPEMRVETLSPMMNDEALFMSVRNAATWVVMEAQGEMHRESDQRQSLTDLIRRNGVREP